MVDSASHSATGSGRAIARFFGNSSPNTICTTVENTSASTVPIAMPTAVGHADPAEQFAEPAPDQRFGDVADQQAGHGDAQLGAREHEGRAPRDRQRARSTRVTGLGARLSRERSTAMYANSWATKYPVSAVIANTTAIPATTPSAVSTMGSGARRTGGRGRRK